MAVKILTGDCIESMKTLEDKSIHTCVTSPPYYGLRDYGNEAQIGLEETPEEYVQKMVEVFREVKRVLRDDGTLWLNIGDSYNGSGGAGGDYNKGGLKEGQPKYPGRNIPSLKPKDLIGIPWMLAFALRADGWYLRQDIIWHKPNSMPESVKDRCTKAHEYIFLLSKSSQYFYDHEVIKEPLAAASIGRAERKQSLMDRAGVGTIGKQASGGFNPKHGYAGLALGRNGKTGYDLDSGSRNKRSVWTITTKPFKGAHFATFPPDLIEPCILAGSPIGGTVLDPFGGSGTTACVAIEHGRSAVLCELNPDYVVLAEQRIENHKKVVGIADERLVWL